MLPTDIFEVLYTNLLNDKRLSVCHCSIYMALILIRHKNELANPFPISRKGIKELAHVNNIVTFPINAFVNWGVWIYSLLSLLQLL